MSTRSHIKVRRFYIALAILTVILLGDLVATALLFERQTTALADQTIPLAPSPTPIPNGAMWTVGTGGDGENPYVEWVGIYPVSSRWDILGAPSLRFSDQSPVEPGMDRSFEIGFYKYGPTWYTRNSIVEFWVGGPEHGGGSLSIIGNDNSGGQLEVRNPTDTGHITLAYRDADHPVLAVDPSNPLALYAEQGLISESEHTFLKGIFFAPEAERAGQAGGDGWTSGLTTVQSTTTTADSLVIITPITEAQGQWWISEVIPGEGFVVESSASAENMSFNWLIIN